MLEEVGVVGVEVEVAGKWSGGGSDRGDEHGSNERGGSDASGADGNDGGTDGHGSMNTG